MHEFVLDDLSVGDERGVKIMARHYHSVSRGWERVVLRHVAPIAAGARRAGVQAVWIHLPLEHSQLGNKVQRCTPPALSIIPLSLVAAPKNDPGDPGIPDCRQLEHPVIVINVR